MLEAHEKVSTTRAICIYPRTVTGIRLIRIVSRHDHRRFHSPKTC